MLEPNYPNPFNPSTCLRYYLPEAAPVVVQILNLRGQLVETLVEDRQSAGWHSLQWNAAPYSAGIYWCRVQTQKAIKVQKLLYLK